MTENNKNEENKDEKLEVENIEKTEDVVEKPKIPVISYKRPPAFVNTNNFSKWKSQQNANMIKMVRRSWWRGR